MYRRHRRKKTYILLLVVAAVAIVVAAWNMVRSSGTVMPVQVEAWIYDKCGNCTVNSNSCKPCYYEIELNNYLARHSEWLTDKGNYNISVYNTKNQSALDNLNNNKYFQTVKSEYEGKYPVVIINKQIIVGWDNIEADYVNSLKQELENAGIDINKEFVDNYEDRDKYGFSFFTKPTIVYFYLDNCNSCDNVSVMFDEINTQGTCDILSYSINDEAGKDLFVQYCNYYEVNYSDTGAPIVFIGDKYLEGEEEINMFLMPYIDNGYADNTPSITRYDL